MFGQDEMSQNDMSNGLRYTFFTSVCTIYYLYSLYYILSLSETDSVNLWLSLQYASGHCQSAL